MRKIRHLSLLIILGGLSLSGIAFSSWITTNSNPSFDVSIDVGSINNLSRYFTVSSFTPFKYNSEGFINEDTPTQTSLSRALISSVIKYNVKQAKAEISNLNSLSLKLTYKHLYGNEVSSSEQTNNLYAYSAYIDNFSYLQTINVYLSSSTSFAGIEPTTLFERTYSKLDSTSNNGVNIYLKKLAINNMNYDTVYIKVEQIFNIPFIFDNNPNTIIKNLAYTTFSLSLSLEEASN